MGEGSPLIFFRNGEDNVLRSQLGCIISLFPVAYWATFSIFRSEQGGVVQSEKV